MPLRCPCFLVYTLCTTILHLLKGIVQCQSACIQFSDAMLHALTLVVNINNFNHILIIKDSCAFINLTYIYSATWLIKSISQTKTHLLIHVFILRFEIYPVQFECIYLAFWLIEQYLYVIMYAMYYRTSCLRPTNPYFYNKIEIYPDRAFNSSVYIQLSGLLNNICML